MEATIDGRAVLLGNLRLMEERGVALDGLRDRADALAAAGKTPMYLARDGAALGIVAVADTVKPTAAAAIQALHALGLEVVLLTGDNRRVAEAVGQALGVDRVVAEVLPSGKVDEVKRLQALGKRVAMVGDGINDAPALAQADLGVAIGTGADVALEASDVTLVGGDPRGVATAIALSRATLRTIRQNLFWAFFYNVLLIPLAPGRCTRCSAGSSTRCWRRGPWALAPSASSATRCGCAASARPPAHGSMAHSDLSTRFPGCKGTLLPRGVGSVPQPALVLPAVQGRSTAYGVMPLASF